MDPFPYYTDPAQYLTSAAYAGSTVDDRSVDDLTYV